MVIDDHIQSYAKVLCSIYVEFVCCDYGCFLTIGSVECQLGALSSYGGYIRYYQQFKSHLVYPNSNAECVTPSKLCTPE